MNSDIGFEDVTYYLPGPPQDVTNAPQLRLSEERLQLTLASGCRYFYVAPDMSEVELACAATAPIVERHGLRADDVDVIIHIHSLPFAVPPAPSSLPMELARRFDLRPRLAFSISHLNCASLVGALQSLKALMQSHPSLQRALIVSADRICGEEHRSRYHAEIQSDGAACMLVTRNCRRNRVSATALRNYSELHAGPQASAAAERKMISMEWLYTRKVVQDALHTGGLTAANIATLIPVNTDGRGWTGLARLLGRDASWVYLENLGTKGHVFGADVAINLVDAKLLDLAPEQNVLCCMQSNIGAYGALILQAARPH